MRCQHEKHTRASSPEYFEGGVAFNSRIFVLTFFSTFIIIIIQEVSGDLCLHKSRPHQSHGAKFTFIMQTLIPRLQRQGSRKLIEHH